MSSITNLISVGVNGTGTANSVMKWLDADTATDSAIYESSGNVLISDTTYAGFGQLQIGNASTTTTRLQMISSPTVGSGGIHFGDTTSATNGRFAGFLLYDHNGDYMRLGTTSTERLRIDASGNVGIGTSSPSSAGSGYTGLDIRGTGGGSIRYGVTSGFNMLTYATGSSVDYVTSSAANIRWFNIGGGESMRIDSAGNVGIGVVPSAWTSVGSTKALQISTMSAVFEAYSGTFLSNNIYFDGSTKHITTAPAARLGLLSDGALQFMNAPSGTAGSAASLVERMRIDSSGNVGIGTTDILAELAIKATNAEIHLQPNADTEYTALVFRNAANNSTRGYVLYDYTNDYMSFRTNGIGERMRITSGGDVLIGTTSSSGSASNVTRLSGGIFSTANGSIGLGSSGVAYTIFTIPASLSAWLVTINVSAGATSYSETALINVNNSAVAVTLLSNGGNVAISNSGLNIQATQSSGANQNIYWNAIRIA